MTERRRKIEYGDFQTPIALADEVCSLLYRLDVCPRTIVEPACGEGSFLEAAAHIFGTDAAYFGFDINPDYIATAERRMRLCHPSAIVHLKTQDFFAFDWKAFLQSLAQPILFLGNPPWVTSAALGALNSDNLPLKSNLKRLDGLDALTGKANFDISEWMLLKLMEAAGKRDYAIAMLCKTGVARKALEYQWRNGETLPESALFRIDAARWFDAAVDACLFVARSRTARATQRSALLYDTLSTTVHSTRFGIVDGQIVSNVDTYQALSHLKGINYYRWRSGVKHDLAKVMELRSVDGQLVNGFGEEVDIEDSCLYPLLKATDVAKGNNLPERYVLVTQSAIGEETEHLRDTAPRTYRYLEQHDALFAERKSSIYRGQPKYCLFGIGEYTFAPFKVAISGLHKSLAFTLLTPYNGKPVLVDDTCYFIGSFDQREARLLYELLNSDIVLRFLESSIFADSKRPVTAEVLNRLDLKKVAEQLGRADELADFLQGGNVESNGQGMLVFGRRHNIQKQKPSRVPECNRRDRTMNRSSGKICYFHLTLALTLLVSLSFTARADDKHAHPAPAASYVRLEITPASILLDGRKARQQLLITGVRQDGSLADVTETAQFVSSEPGTVKIGQDGVAHPVADGKTTLTVKVGGRTAQVPVEARHTRRPFTWSFENHVESVLSRQGCNMGICHGAASGKGGFRLSLRAFDPQADYERLRHEGRGRRLSLISPTESLLLKKPSLALAHYGGLRLPPGSLEYRVVEEWVAAGAPGPKPDTPTLVGLEVFPAERALAPGASQRLLVTARFSDGHTEDVTRWARYSSNEENLATVDENGRASMRAVGETAISVWYLGHVTFARLRVPFPNRIAAQDYDRLPARNLIDTQIHAKLRQMRLWPSGPCTDAEFLRRAMLDTLGVLPTPEELNAFAADIAPDKRDRCIEALLARPEYVDRWTYVWCDLLRVNRDMLGEKGMWSFYRWVQSCVAENVGWDRMAREVVTAQGRASENGPVNFYRMGAKPEEFAETVSQAFLGIRVQCAHCHNHPFEKWTQSDYYRMANFFSRVGRKGGDADPTVYAAESGEVEHPRLHRSLPPAAFEGPTLALEATGDRRAFLADWMTAPDNPYFARNLVNRVWKRMMGRGLVEPVDDMRLTNPASNAPLLDALSRDFAAHGYDIKRLLRMILQSNAYQRSTRPNATNRADDRFYSRCLPRRLPAETLLDAISQVTGQPEAFEGFPTGTRAAALPDTQITSMFLDTFGRPARQVTCECERNNEPNVAQALHLINAQTLNARIQAKDGQLQQYLASGKSDREITDLLYLTSLSRLPTPQERTAIEQALRAAQPSASAADKSGPPADAQATRKQVFADLLWALLSGPEFQFNH
ncbi:MAG TPA: DUF1549 domain-containing protein [Chthonomonadaceae bacterium]|nr:DUF1549 domain-containing protein [Chthonomonadaceae bacterium]